MLVLRSLVFLLPWLTAGALLAACGDDDGGNNAMDEATSGGGGPAESLSIIAENNEFNKDELKAPANSGVSLDLDNQDEGVLHNVAVYRSSDAQDAIFVGDLFAGVETRSYTFETPDSGEYFFRCNVHPDTMTGTFLVE